MSYLSISLVPVRWIRSRDNGRDHDRHVHEKESSSTGQSEDPPNTNEPDQKKPKVDPALQVRLSLNLDIITSLFLCGLSFYFVTTFRSWFFSNTNKFSVRKLRIYVLVVGCLSFVMSFLILSQMATGQVEMGGMQPEFLSRQGIDMKSFLEKYLRAGEVRRIVFCPDYSRAVAFLYEGAVIDGKKVHEPVVVVAYSKDAQQFWADIRKEEEDMGISVSDGVHIDMYRGMTTFRLGFLSGYIVNIFVSLQISSLKFVGYCTGEESIQCSLFAYC
ncbi:hypothetical protein ANCCAN_23326 [Ancylostoma caninum]|uniref:Uncharacterized protein n=1 Tax=Ancylostoma caninum TaxID=29170 RepID=A0A368FFB9_ANCCA|nr:hypothetical protein ANCCAN_23326 [Ancylostoma caninum]